MKTKVDELYEEHLLADKTMMLILLAHAFVAVFVSSSYYDTYALGIIGSGLILTLVFIAYLNISGTLLFRLIVATALMLFSSIYIQQHLGRIEMHFHVFIALAILMIYKDIFPMLLAALVIAVHHFLFNHFQTNNFILFGEPIQVFSYGCGIEYVLLHVVMVLAEVIVLAYIIKQSKREFLAMKEAQRVAEADRKTAQEAEQTKTDFLANMSHEVRTPMNGIVGFANLLSKTSLNNTQKQYLKIIDTSIHTLLGVVNNILDFSKLENEKMELDTTPINPFEELENALLIFNAQAATKEIAYTINIDSKLHECLEVDILKLKQILTNLISNAMKFTPNGGRVYVWVTLVEETSSHQRIKISVEDSGIGIPKDRQDSIFKAFTQADNSTTRNFGGTGLGLSISASYVKLMGSELQIHSQVNEGSTFYFELTLPICTSNENIHKSYSQTTLLLTQELLNEHQEITSQLDHFGLEYIVESEASLLKRAAQEKQCCVALVHSKDLAQEITQTNNEISLLVFTHDKQSPEDKDNIIYLNNYDDSSSTLYNFLRRLKLSSGLTKSKKDAQTQLSMKVLVAEDYDINQLLIGELLKHYNIEYDIAQNGAEAVDMALNANYDLILMDINMPIMNGLQATQKLREVFDDTLPIVALTANAAEGQREHFISQGMNDYLSKPIDQARLEEILKRFSKNLQE